MIKMLWGGLAAVLVISVSSVSTATSAVDPSGIGRHSAAVATNDVKPVNCSSLNLDATVSGSGAFTGTGSAELMVASSSADTINGAGGGDCILGGGGDDQLAGGGGNDVCIGGPGLDTFSGNCETTIQ